MVLGLSIAFSSCELTDFEFQDDPNELSQKSVNPDFILNEIQILFIHVMQDLSLNTDDIMRYEAMSDTYTDVAEASAINGEWTDLYALGVNFKTLEALAINNDEIRFHMGIARILKAYSFTSMVDYVGDIPFLEANNPEDFPNPKADSGADIYTTALTEIDAAITDFNNASTIPLTDLYYKGDKEKWIKLANTLKLRLLINRRLTDATESKKAINDLISTNNLIVSIDDDFQFSYSNAATPESRSEYYQRAYLSDGPSEYIGNYFLWMLKDSKSARDPRLRYYIYRQTLQHPGDLGMLRCSDDGGATLFDGFDFCYVGAFYWGRDHGDDDTRPADRFLKSIYGLYPAGGAFDTDNGIAATESANLGGAGLFPVFLSSYTNFLKAEAALTLETTGDPIILLETAIRNSMEKVLGFAAVDATFAATTTDVDNYVAEVMSDYTAAATHEEKLDIVIREYYLAAFGNSMESYNAYRRTGYPSNIQEPIKNENIPFPRSFPYPEDAINTNTSLVVKPVTIKVFWDTNPDGFIK